MKKFSWLGMILITFGLMLSLYLPLPEKQLTSSNSLSLIITDRNGIILREVLSDKGGYCQWLDLSEISPALIKATLAAEDRYFFLHPGINPISIIRAMSQNIRHLKVISGASTITQQLIRNIYPRNRNILSKLFEAWMALRLEKSFAKEEILAQYLNRINYGNQAFGIQAAAQLYFDKPASDLSLAESAFLAGLPRSPTHLNPYRNMQKAIERQQEILQQMYQMGYTQEQDLLNSLDRPLKIVSERQKFRAPHFCDFLLKQLPLPESSRISTIQTTLDYRLQEKIESLVEHHINSLKNKSITNAAVIVLDNRNREILSMVGSRDFFDYDHSGQVNGALALRQPGSTLKPFTYALALERGKTAASLLDDAEIQFLTPNGNYHPENYDRRYHGQVRLREALACSYNVPAVAIVKEIGPDALFQTLKQMDFTSLDRTPSYYGIGLTLGNGEVNLLELVRAYSTLAKFGNYARETLILSYMEHGKENWIPYKRNESVKPVFSPEIAYIISDILSDNNARIPAFGYNSPLNLPFPCSVKTGTSKDFRDNWTIGYTSKYTVGIWVGNFDGKAMQKVSGISGCGPLFRDIMLLLENKKPSPPFKQPDTVICTKVCPVSGYLAGDKCPGSIDEIFIAGTSPTAVCPFHSESNSQK
ncbi:MAG: penicillin-binding protein 1C, partial [Candidatus Aminicenantes bacterium]|nr:penicillin-binding protein 1C [Candidatus Aminicenantes bacterium]